VQDNVVLMAMKGNELATHEQFPGAGGLLILNVSSEYPEGIQRRAINKVDALLIFTRCQ
jgi:hypothetical protein